VGSDVASLIFVIVENSIVEISACCESPHCNIRSILIQVTVCLVMVVIVELWLDIGDPEVSLELTISIVVLGCRYIWIHCLEEFCNRISFAESRKRHIKLSLRLVTDAGESGRQQQRHNYEDFHDC
jgi:hypothetical protein